MKKEQKKETFIYEGLGFPIRLVNCPMKKIFGEWVLDINLGQLQRDILRLLVYKNQSLSGTELRFIRKYFELTTTAFGKALGVTHAAVLKWESGQGRIPPTTELCIRLFILDKMKAKNEEFGRLYHKVTIEKLAQRQEIPLHDDLFEFNANQKLASA